ncbi:methyltransferase domain-containing protein [Kiritimatiella glycovorans]|uniref:methyltransferase domain-containing protein n=1 Tax=Kiritimatiella glycovorans TaxID=1307763 RepID=UPI001364DB0E|nr:methyltransferase domain-containing protein [Kiritimatiella glycovorans]
MSRRFSAAAAAYESGAAVQAEVARELVRWMELPEEADRVLELGCGTGLLTRQLCALNPRPAVHAIDASAAMIDVCRAKTAGGPKLTTEVRDMRVSLPEGPFSRAVSSSALHWIPDLAALFRALAACLEDGARVTFALMLEGTLEELSAARCAAAPGVEPPVSLPSEGGVGRALAEAGMNADRVKTETRTVYYPCAEDLLRDLHERGVTGSPSARRRGLTRGELRKLKEIYRHRHAGPAGLPATYRVGFFDTGMV